MSDLINGYYWVSYKGMKPTILEKHDFGWNYMGSEIEADLYDHKILGAVSEFNSETSDEKCNLASVNGCYSELDMKDTFEAGMYYERSCAYYKAQPKISKAGHLISNPTPDFSEFIYNLNNR